MPRALRNSSPLLLGLLLAAVGSGLAAARSGLAAQTDVYVRIGAAGSGPLVKEFITQDVNAKPSVGPAFFAGIGRPIAPHYGAGLEFGVTSASLRGHSGDATTDLGAVRTASVLALLDGTIARGLRWRGGLGVLHYFAGNEGGILDQGTTRLLVGGGLDFRRPMFAGWDLMISGRYDFHRFSSPALQSHGYTGAEGVQRVSLSIGLARSHP